MKYFATILFVALSVLAGGSILSKSLLRYNPTVLEWPELATAEETEADPTENDKAEESESEQENCEDQVLPLTDIQIIPSNALVYLVDSFGNLSLLTLNFGRLTPPPERLA